MYLILCMRFEVFKVVRADCGVFKNNVRVELAASFFRV
jgi:hypothetical protein